jgi:acetylornithine deacetylase/succinyl-diaminopimelate desuccinylase-like protein
VADAALVELASALVAVDSVNPDLVPGGAGEHEAAEFVAGWLRDRGLEVELVGDDARPSVIATARGTGGGKTLLLNGHLDTVGVAGVHAPFEPRVADGRLYGRGAYDMKAAVAAAMAATVEARGLGLAGDVVLTAVADEEVGSIGTEAVIKRVTADAAIVCEPTELRLAVAHRGFAGFEIETRGRAAQGSRPDLGIDAIAKMGRVLVELEALGDRLLAGARHPLLGPGSLHASLIEGGQEYSSYPERCLVTGERRLLPGESTADLETELQDVLAGARGADSSLQVEARLLLSRDAFEIDAGHELVRTVAAAAGDPEIVGLPFWADSGLTAAAGIPTVLFGPAGEGAHALVEWVDLESVERCRDVYVAVARAVCG